MKIVERNESDPRMCYYRFATDAIDQDPAVNVLLPDHYAVSGCTFPVLFLLRIGMGDLRSFDGLKIRELIAGKPINVGWRG
jgi:hypothetical protein